MSGSIKNVLLVGASGTLGPHVLKAFEGAGFNLTILSRPTSTKTFADDVKVIKKDYSDAEGLQEAFTGQDAVISLVGPAAMSDQPKLIEAAVKAGVKRFVPSEFGSNTFNPQVRELVSFYKLKLAIIEQLKKASEDNPSFSWSALCTGPFFDWGIKTSFLGYNLADHTAIIYDDGENKVSYSNMAAVGGAVVGIVKNPSETANKYLYIASATTSQNVILAALEKETGKKFTVTKASTAEARAEGGAKMAKGDFSGIRTLLHGVMYGNDVGGNFEEHGLANKTLGLPEETVEETIKETVAGRIP